MFRVLTRHCKGHIYKKVDNLKTITNEVNSAIFKACSTSSSNSNSETTTMDLSKVVKRLHKIASPSLAGSWDNVGLLVEPSAPHIVKSVLLTNDLTPPVLEEAIANKSDMVISYHPPIFTGLKRLTQKKWKEEIIVKCIENRIAIYSPHTSYDCVEGGVNDWLINCFDVMNVRPVEGHEEFPTNFTHKVGFDISSDKVAGIMDTMKTVQEVVVAEHLMRSEGSEHFRLHCTAPSLRNVMKIVQDDLMPFIKNLEVSQLSKAPKPHYGMGRRAALKEAISLEDAVKVVKRHLKLEHVRLATASDKPNVSSVAVCAGSGSSVLRNVPVDLYVTGEMSHHDVLHAVYSGTSVILCEHSNTERGFLSELQKQLKECLDVDTKIFVSKVDSDPLKVV